MMIIYKKLLFIYAGILCTQFSFGQSVLSSDTSKKFATFRYCYACGISKRAVIQFDDNTIIDAKKISGTHISYDEDDTTVINNIHVVFKYLDAQGFELVTSNSTVPTNGYNPFISATFLFYFKRKK